MDAVGSAARPSGDEVRAGTRWLLVAFAVLTALAVVELLVLADVADRFWAWPIPTELTAAFLGAAYAAGFVLAVAALRQHRWSRIRVPLLTVTAFTLLGAAATVVHLHRLSLLSGEPVARAVAWAWLMVYLVVPLACLAVVVGQERRRPRRQEVVRPMPGWLAGLLAAQGSVLFVAGALLFTGGITVHHHEPEEAMRFWPWSLTPLSAMVVGAWLLSLGLAAALAIRQRDLSRLLVSGVTYTAFGVFQFVALLWHWPQVSRHGPWLWVYLVVLASIVLAGAYGWRAARRGSAADRPADRPGWRIPTA